MKKIYLSIVLLFVISFSAKSQEQRINLYGGYVFDNNVDKFNDYNQYVNGTVKGGGQYGGSLEFLTPDDLGVELMYIGQMTTMPLSFDAGFLTGARSGTMDLNLNYALVGINKYARSEKVEGYGGLMLGCLFSNADNIGFNDSSGTKYTIASSSGTRFTWGLKLGANIWVKDNIGIKLQSQFLSTTQAVGGSSYYGYYGNYYGYYSYINLFQWSFSTGLVFRFGYK